MLVGWAILSPLSRSKGWAPGPVGDMASGARGWILWTSLAIMVSDSLISLFPIVREFTIKLIRSMKKSSIHIRLPGVAFAPGSFSDITPDDHDDGDEQDPEPPERLVPMQWVLWGLGFSIVMGILLVWVVFGHEGIKPWATSIGFLLGGVLSLLGYNSMLLHSNTYHTDTNSSVRALGETDLNPVSGLGKISQLLFAFIQPGNVVANIIAGGVAEAGAQQYVVSEIF